MLIGLNANLLGIMTHSFFLFFLFLELLCDGMRNFGTTEFINRLLFFWNLAAMQRAAKT